MSYTTHFTKPKVGEKFQLKGANPFKEPAVFSIKEIRKDNLGINWYHLDSESEYIYLNENDLFNDFVQVID